MTVQDSVRVFESVSLGYPRYHCASPKNKKQTDLLLKKITMGYLVEILNIAVLTALCMYGYLVLIAVV